MKTLHFLAVLAVSSVISNAEAGNLTIGVDLSGSTNLLTDQNYADALAASVAAKIKTLEFGDKVYFKTFGDSGTQHIKTLKPLVISKKMRSERAAQRVASRIRQLPSTVKGEKSTNILAFVENGTFACDKKGSALWLLTDGIEASRDFDGRELLQGKSLPEPYRQSLNGCEVMMIGVGRLSGHQMARKDIHILNREWTKWLSAAGAKSVDIRVDPPL